MRVSLSWLKDFVDINVRPEVLAESLSMKGFEVESIEDLSKFSEGVIVAYVEKVSQHPNAEKLKVCEIRTDKDNVVQVVCGANNIRAGIHVALAPVGIHLSAINITIKPTKLRGVLSNGMVCSKSEIGLEEDSQGIIILEDHSKDIPLHGSPITEFLKLNDVVFDIAITANRPDGMSVIGLAREISAIYGTTLNSPKYNNSTNYNNNLLCSDFLEFLDADPVFTMTLFENTKISNNTPEIIKQRLISYGIRPINLYVDLCNYVMVEQGQPLHVYDGDLLANILGRPVTHKDFRIRKAKNDEKFKLLDGSDINLTSKVTVITCGNTPISLAGVIGSCNSSVSSSTKTIWLESGNFKQNIIRQSSKAISLKTDSSSRFEKGIPGGITICARDRFAYLLHNIEKLASSEQFYVGSLNTKLMPIILRVDKVRNVLGYLKSRSNPAGTLLASNDDLFSKINVSGDEIMSDIILKSLSSIGCELVEVDSGWEVTIPCYRNKDLTREIDLIEEIARLIGYDNFESYLPDPLKPGLLNSRQSIQKNLSILMCASGFQEITTMSLVPKGGDSDLSVPISNPLMKETSHLRTNLWQEHIDICVRNMKNGQQGIWIFEIGNIFNLKAENFIETKSIISGVICGENRLEKWSKPKKDASLNYYEARGVLKVILDSLKLDVHDQKLDNDDILHPGRASILILEGKMLGKFGQLHPEITQSRELPTLSYLFELDLERILNASTRPVKYTPSFKPYSTYPAMERDISLYVDSNINSSEITNLVKKIGKKLLEKITLIDMFKSEDNQNKVSYTYRLCYRKQESTLTEEEILPIHQDIIEKLEGLPYAKIRK